MNNEKLKVLSMAAAPKGWVKKIVVDGYKDEPKTRIFLPVAVWATIEVTGCANPCNNGISMVGVTAGEWLDLQDDGNFCEGYFFLPELCEKDPIEGRYYEDPFPPEDDSDEDDEDDD